MNYVIEHVFDGRLKLESVLDFPSSEMDQNIWIGVKDPPLVDGVRNQILSALVDFNNVAKINGVYVVGSLTTNKFNKNSDLDVTIILDKDVEEATIETLKKLVVGKNGVNAINSNHPINYFVRKDFNVDAHPGAYDVINNKWVKRYEGGDSFDPFQYFGDFESKVKSVDLTAAELKRDVVDYEIIKNANPSQVKELDNLAADKLKEIEDGIISLVATYKDLKADRNEMFDKPMTPEQIKKFGNKYNMPANVLYKFYERYYYTDFMHNLSVILKAGVKDQKDVAKVKDAINKDKLK